VVADLALEKLQGHGQDAIVLARQDFASDTANQAARSQARWRLMS